MTKKLILFYAHSGDDNADYGAVSRSDGFDGFQTNLIAQYYDCSDSPVPSEGYRPSERKKGLIGERPTTTHHRPGPWTVERVESYPADLPTGTEFDEIIICTCGYAPLPEDENPWIKMIQRQVSEEQLVSA